MTVDREWLDASEPSVNDTGTDPASLADERVRLREVLGFPEPIESVDVFTAERPAIEEPAPDPTEITDDDLAVRVDHLAGRVEAVAGLVEALFHRFDERPAEGGLSIEQLADVAARMVHIIETRLADHREQLELKFGEAAAGSPMGAALDPRAHLAQIDDQLALLGRTLMEVKTAVVDLERPVGDTHAAAMGTQVGLWFEETNARVASELEHLRAAVEHNDWLVLDLVAKVQGLPDHESLRGVGELRGAGDEPVRELRAAVDELREQMSAQTPVHRLDTEILQQIDVRLEEMGEQLAGKVEDQLAARVQRFEALSQSMMLLVGEPIDQLTAKLQELARTRDPAGDLAAQRDAMERLVERLERLAAREARD